MARLDLYINYELQTSIKLKGNEIDLGRAPNCAVQIPDPQVSRRHAVIYSDHETHSIENLGANGTRVNGRPIDTQHQLEPGDVIFISSHILVYQPDDAPVEHLDATVITPD